MSVLEFKKNKENFEINLFEKNSRSSKISHSHYTNVIDKNPKQLAQILIDLYLDGFKVNEAIKIFMKRVSNRDWLGF